MKADALGSYLTELKEGTKSRSPEDRGAELTAGKRRGGKIARTDTGGGDQQPWPDQREEAAPWRLSPRGSTQRWRPRALS